MYCCEWLLELTESTEGGAFLYRFSRFLFGTAFECATISPEAVVSRGDSHPSSASRLSGLGKTLVPAKSPEIFASY